MSGRPPLRRVVRLAFVFVAVTALVAGPGRLERATATSPAAAASGWEIYKLPQGQPVCSGLGVPGTYFDRLDCGFGSAAIGGTSAANVVVFEFVSPAGAVVASRPGTFRTDLGDIWRFSFSGSAGWPSGKLTIRARVDGQLAEGEAFINFQMLGAGVAAESRPQGYEPGDAVPLRGALYEIDTFGGEDKKTPVAGTYSLRVVTSSGEVRGPYGPFTANRGGAGQIAETLPASATAGLTATADTNYQTTIRVEAVDASYADPVTGRWTADVASAGAVTLSVPPPTLVLENRFVSAVGWVKPGETYPFRVLVKNFGSTAETGASVTIPAPDGTTFVRAEPLAGAGTASISAGTIAWTIGDVPARTDAGPGLKTLVVEARADRASEDPQIVWKDISAIATLTYGTTSVVERAHGPKVVPPGEAWETARYGDRPFPVVPVDYSDRKHEAEHAAERLLAVINSEDVPGSTYNLYQEMSYGQLHPHGTVPSAAVASADFGVEWKSDRYRESGFAFTLPLPGGACTGATIGTAAGTAVYAERIHDGWYQLPGDTSYYGNDRTWLANALAVGSAADIDNACGPIAKAVYDAAHIADPEIDYSDYDTDKDGVVDFFMMVFAGLGGNGVSQLSSQPYDNIWPHSSSLEFYYEDAATKQTGYISDDQLRDNEERPLYYTDASRQNMTTTATDFPVYVRVGPYNVNPEAAIEQASVISHEYGHSLGLPDFYSTGDRSTYGDWNLMATDKSQHMDVFSKQELGWIVPRPLSAGETTVTGWRDSKADTDRIDWVQPDGTPYTLSGAEVANGEAYVAKLPGRILIDPAKFENASASHAWWSQSGNDFGCAPEAGHNLDVYLPELATVPAGTPVTLTFKSYWDIEWDYDYGFVLVTTDGGESYTSLESKKGYTTPAAFNPHANACQTRFGNGLTGTSGSYAAGTQAVDRPDLVTHYEDGGFLADEYDLSAFAGKATTLRFSYATDPGLARPGWFVDDVEIRAGDRVIYSSDFETSGDARLFNGGCQGTLTTAKACTDGWQHVSSSDPSAADHAYYLELRDRSGFDLEGKGQNDRTPIGFLPGLLLVYTDEAHGYGNAGTDGAPAQSPLDAHPQAGNITPNLGDAAFRAADVPRFSDSGTGWVDNYADPRRPDGLWRFDYDCLTFDVLAMSGDDLGPATSPGNLTADVRLAAGAGCAPFDYGHVDEGPPPNQAPTAVLQMKPASPHANQQVKLDASASNDPEDALQALSFRWDFDGDGAWDATGQTARHKYRDPGTYETRLEVTDTGGLTDVASVTVTVRERAERGRQAARGARLRPGASASAS